MKKETSSQAESILESVWEQTPNQCAVLVSKFLAGSFIKKLRYSQALIQVDTATLIHTNLLSIDLSLQVSENRIQIENVSEKE